MNNYNEVKKSFGTQAEKFASYHMSKAEYTDYLIRSIQAKGNEHALEVAAGKQVLIPISRRDKYALTIGGYC